MTIQEFHDNIQFILRKEKSGYRTHEEIDDMAHLAQLEHFTNIYRTFSVDHKVHRDLLPFKETLLLNVYEYSDTNLGGTIHNEECQIKLPSNHEYTRSIHQYQVDLIKKIDEELIVGGDRTINTTLKRNRRYRIICTFDGDAELILSHGDTLLTPVGAPNQDGEFEVTLYTPGTDDLNFVYNLDSGEMGSIVVYQLRQSAEGNIPVKVVDEDELSNLLNNEIAKPTTEFPAAILDNDMDGDKAYVLFPKQSIYGELKYLKTPPAPLYSYTVLDRVETHFPLTSQDLLWGEAAINKIITLTLQRLGVSLSDSQVIQYTSQKQNEEA